ncbi:serine hydrolase domain-containing protein [Lunatibacter salilacus]|uniref:serine hydrolase domain-containing protein n=1 Tax=Lunatibacter salilacus TaxID=2483804 RepID=UPI00131C5323|nr:serine hydrolase domain-containing protein [Lunatibacter salilacus]
MKNFLNQWILCLALVLLSCDTDREEPAPEIRQESISAIDSRMGDMMNEFYFPGISIAIAKNGKLVYARGYGTANQQTEEAVTPESIFRYASFAKTITGIAVMKLVQDNKLSLEDKVFGADGILGMEYGTKTYSNRITAITVDHLLHHVPGGWRNFMDDPVFDGPANLSRDELISWGLDNVPLATNPGSTYHYSNFGYLILGRIIEKASGKSYGEYVKEEILDRVGATSTFLARNGKNEKRSKEVEYYSQDSTDPYTSTAYNIERGDATAGWVSTPSDIARILSSVDLQPGRPNLLNQQLNNLRGTPLSNSGSYGKGVYRFNHPELGEVHWHDGLWPGSQSLSVSKKGEFCISVVMNSGVFQNYTQSMNNIAGTLFEIMMDDTIEYQDIDQF